MYKEKSALEINVYKITECYMIKVQQIRNICSPKMPKTNIANSSKLKDLSWLLQVGDKGVANGFNRYNS